MARDAGAETPAPPQGSGEAKSDTFFLPADFPGADSLSAGDTITLKVVGPSENGEIEVEPMPEEGGEPDWKSDMRESLGAGGEPAAPE